MWLPGALELKCVRELERSGIDAGGRSVEWSYEFLDNPRWTVLAQPRRDLAQDGRRDRDVQARNQDQNAPDRKGLRCAERRALCITPAP